MANKCQTRLSLMRSYGCFDKKGFPCFQQSWKRKAAERSFHDGLKNRGFFFFWPTLHLSQGGPWIQGLHQYARFNQTGRGSFLRLGTRLFGVALKGTNRTIGVLVGCFGRKIDGPGLPGGLIIYQGHLFPLKGHLWKGPSAILRI